MVDCTSPLILYNDHRVVKLYEVVVNIFLVKGNGFTLPILNHVINDAIEIIVFDLVLLKVQFLLISHLGFAL